MKVEVKNLHKSAKFLVTPNLRTGDRSYTDEIFELASFNGFHVQAKRTGKRHSWQGEYVTFLVPEHDFFDAVGFVIEKAEKSKISEPAKKVSKPKKRKSAKHISTGEES